MTEHGKGSSKRGGSVSSELKRLEQLAEAARALAIAFSRTSGPGTSLGDSAFDDLVDRILDHRAPDAPEGWLRKRIRSLGIAEKEKRRKTQRLDDLAQEPTAPTPEDQAASARARRRLQACKQMLKKLEPQLRSILTPRQTQVLDPIHVEATIKALARVSGLNPRDIRHIILQIAKKARKVRSRTKGK